MEKMETRDLVQRLGGAGSVAAELGVRPNVVGMWCARDSVPARWLVPMWRLALRRGVPWEPPGAAGLTLTGRAA
ncbi:MAG: hypothetical protein KGH75_00875 [Rhodospirillales bacterium]|nr:hypothetical protein [Rhodospirillales bacterium]